MSKSKICFVISPIGDEGSKTRIRSDKILKHIISPAATKCGYTIERADLISKPGIITSQIIQHIVQDALVVADLTDHNPNVFYELALRHALKKPVVQIIQSGQSMPFDLASTRTIKVDHTDLDSAENAKEEIVKQIGAVEQDATEVDNPISVALDLQLLRQSDKPLEKSIAEIIYILQNLRVDIRDLRVDSRHGDGQPWTLEDLANSQLLGRNSYAHELHKQAIRDERSTRYLADAVSKNVKITLESIFDAQFREKSRPVAIKAKPSKNSTD